jgi:hypothetical protein
MKLIGQIRCWWYCLWHPQYRMTYTSTEQGRLVAITATDEDYRIHKVFWLESGGWVAPMPHVQKDRK